MWKCVECNEMNADELLACGRCGSSLSKAEDGGNVVSQNSLNVVNNNTEAEQRSEKYEFEDILEKIKNTADIGKLEQNDLIRFLESGIDEAKEAESIVNILNDYEDKTNQLFHEKEEATRVSIPIAIIAFMFYIIPGIIYIFVKRGKSTKYDEAISAIRHNIINKEKKLEETIKSCRILPLIPRNYRTSLALSTILKYFESGQADNWKEASLRCDEQMHRWQLEQNSNEALELQRYTARMSELSAQYARTTARNTTFSAVNEFLS